MLAVLFESTTSKRLNKLSQRLAVARYSKINLPLTTPRPRPVPYYALRPRASQVIILTNKPTFK